MSRRRPSLVLFAAVAALAVGFPAPASADGPLPEHLVFAFLMDYFPSSRVSIKQGETILFIDADPTAGPGHSFTEDVPLDATPRFDSGVVPPGTFREVTDVSSLAPGEYKVRCSIHVAVKGRLTVG